MCYHCIDFYEGDDRLTRGYASVRSVGHLYRDVIQYPRIRIEIHPEEFFDLYDAVLRGAPYG